MLLVMARHASYINIITQTIAAEMVAIANKVRLGGLLPEKGQWNPPPIYHMSSVVLEAKYGHISIMLIMEAYSILRTCVFMVCKRMYST